MKPIGRDKAGILILAVIGICSVGAICPARWPSPEAVAEVPAFPFPDRWSGYPEMFEKIDAYLDVVEYLVALPAEFYAKWNGRYPATFSDLCGSPFLPANCEEIMSPLDGKKIKDLKPGELGAVEFALEGTGSSEQLIIKPYFLNPESGRAESHPATWNRRWPVKSLDGLEDPASRGKPPLPREVIGAYYLYRILNGLASNYRECEKTNISAAGFLERTPALKLLRNPATNAPVVLREVKTRSEARRGRPGEILYVKSDGTVEVLTEDGKPVQDRIADLLRMRNRGAKAP